jgi:hypothetical protein
MNFKKKWNNNAHQMDKERQSVLMGKRMREFMQKVMFALRKT